MAETAILRIVSWNVHGWRGADGNEDPERAARLLQEVAADIVGLQEVVNHDDDVSGHHPLARLAARDGLTAINGPTIIHPHGDYGNALLTRLPVRQVRHIDLSFPQREPRAALDVELEEDGHSLRVIVTHLGLRPVERRFQVRRLIQAIEEHRASPLILMGDLNEWFVYGRPARWLHRHFGDRGGPATFPTRCPLFALDRIFVAPPDRLESVVALRTPLARLASDHLPVMAQVVL